MFRSTAAARCSMLPSYTSNMLLSDNITLTVNITPDLQYTGCPNVCLLPWGWIMVLISDDNSEHVAYSLREIGFFGEKNPIFDCSQSKQMP